MRKPKLAAERREMQALRAMASGTLLQRRSERSLHSFLKMVWPVLPIPKHRPIGLRVGEMTVVACRR